jgi:hypothetical protein
MAGEIVKKKRIVLKNSIQTSITPSEVNIWISEQKLDISFDDARTRLIYHKYHKCLDNALKTNNIELQFLAN